MIHYLDLNNGSDSNGGTSNTDAWLTFAHANTNSSSGDTIRMVDGTYTLVGTTTLSLIGDRIYDCETKWGFIIDGNVRNDSFVNQLRINVETVELICEIKNWKFYDLTNHALFNGAGLFSPNTGMLGAGKLVITDCFFEDIHLGGNNDTGGMVQTYFVSASGDQSISVFNGCTFKGLRSRIDQNYLRSHFSVAGKITLNNCTYIRTETTGSKKAAIFGRNKTYDPTNLLIIDRCIFLNISGDDATMTFYYWVDMELYTSLTNSSWKGFTEGSIGGNRPSNGGVDGNLAAETDPLLVDAVNGFYQPRPNSPLAES